MTPSAAIVADAPVSLPAALAGQRDPLAASLDIPDTASLLRRPDGDRREASQVTAPPPPPAPVAPMVVAPLVAPPPPITASPTPTPTSFTSETPVSEPDPLPAVPAAQEQAPTSEDASDSAAAAAVALSFPQELEAWRDARARTRGESPDDPVGPKPRVLPEPVDATTRPSPLAPTESADLLPTVPADLAPTVPAALTPTERPARRSTSRRRHSEDEDAALRRPAGAPLEAMAGSPVDFVLSEMGVWPGGVDEGGEGPAPDVPADDAPSFVAAAQRRAFWRSRPVRIALGLGALVLLLALVLQVAVSRRSWLAAHVPSLAPALTAVCQPLGCTVPPYRDLDAIVIDSSAFNRSGPSSFRFTVTLRNQSTVPVATPALELTLTDALEQPVVRRVVGPNELSAPSTLAAKGEFAGANALLLTGVDNASAITGYRLMAFYP